MDRVDAGQFAGLVAGASDEQLAEGLAQNRGPLLEEVFRQMPRHFDARKAGDIEAVIEWRITGPPEGSQDRYQVAIRAGACRVEHDGGAAPRVTFTIDGVNFLRLITGNASGPMLFTFGKLKIQGDLLLAARVQGFFDIPAASG